MPETAPLVATPDAPIPDGGAAEWFVGAGGARLRAALFPAVGQTRGSVVLSPGRTEPIEKYFETVSDLTARGFVVLVHDWRGHGLSIRMLPDRLLGHAHGYKDFLTDYAALLDAFEARLPKPWIAMGHSMGGCLTLLAMACGEARFSAAILSAPMLGLQTGSIPLPVARSMARLMSATGRGGRAARPGGPEWAPFEENVLTHDRARYQRNIAQVEACPELALGAPTLGWLDFAFSAVGVLQRGPGVRRIAVPVHIVAAGEDRLVDNAGLKRVAERAPKGVFSMIPGAFHEILQETDVIRAAFWRDFDGVADAVAR